jgi:hypothetical protein
VTPGLDRVHRACLQLRESWPRAEVLNALDAEVDAALTAHFGSDPAAVVSQRILEDRRAADQAAHARATRTPDREPAGVLAMPGRRG